MRGEVESVRETVVIPCPTSGGCVYGPVGEGQECVLIEWDLYVSITNKFEHMSLKMASVAENILKLFMLII